MTLAPPPISVITADVSTVDSGTHESRQQTKYFDRDGDLHLEVGPREVTYVVCSRALSRASPVFKRMLSGDFAEAKPAHGDWVVKLPEDDPAALELLLNAIHGCFDKVPEKLPITAFYAVATLADKYLLTHILRPWAGTWLKIAKKDVREDLEGVFLGRGLWIAWVFGDSSLFDDEALDMAMRCRVNKDGLLLDLSAEPWEQDEQMASMDILDSLAQERLRLIKSLLCPMKAALRGLLHAEPDSHREFYGGCEVPSEPDSLTCNIMRLGSLVRNLASAGLYPFPKPKDYSQSAENLHGQSKKLWPHIEGKTLYGHRACNSFIGMIDDIDQALRDVELSANAFQEKHIVHLKRQAKMIGIPYVQLPISRTDLNSESESESETRSLGSSLISMGISLHMQRD